MFYSHRNGRGASFQVPRGRTRDLFGRTRKSEPQADGRDGQLRSCRQVRTSSDVDNDGVHLQATTIDFFAGQSKPTQPSQVKCWWNGQYTRTLAATITQYPEGSIGHSPYSLGWEA